MSNRKNAYFRLIRTRKKVTRYYFFLAKLYLISLLLQNNCIRGKKTSFDSSDDLPVKYLKFTDMRNKMKIIVERWEKSKCLTFTKQKWIVCLVQTFIVRNCKILWKSFFFLSWSVWCILWDSSINNSGFYFKSLARKNKQEH